MRDHPTQTGLIDYELFCGIDPSRGTQGDGPPVPEVDPADVLQRLGTDRPPFLLDVRETWEWEVGNLQARGGRLIPLGDLPGRMGEIPERRPVVVVCRSGHRSLTAARQLLERGFTEVYNLRGGMQAWVRDVDPDLTVA